MASPVLADLAALIPKEAIQALSSSYDFWTWLPFTYVFMGHSLFCALAEPKFRDRFMLHYVLTFLWGNGGGLTTALLLMAPQHAKLSIFASNQVLGIWTVCWWIVNYFPGGLPYQICDQWYIKVFLKSCTALLRALLIIGRVDLGVKLYPGIVAAPLVLGTLAGCGGRLIADALRHGYAELPGLAELTSPGFVSRSAFMAASTYYLLGYVLQILPTTAAAGLVVTILMIHSFATELTGKHLDFTQPVAELLHSLTMVDMPPPQVPAPIKSAIAAATAAASPAAKSRSTPAKSPAKNSPAKAASAKSPSSNKTPYKANLTATDGAPAAADEDGVCEVPSSGARFVSSPVKAATPAKATDAAVLKASDVKLPADGSLAANRPRRSTRRTAAVA